MSVGIEKRGTVAIITIDSPPVNALSAEVIAGLARALEEFEDDSDYSGLIVCGAGKAFVAGGDIAAFADSSFSTLPFNTFLKRLEDQKRPVVAAIHGVAFGGGLELALACHWRVAATGAKFAMPEIRLGLIPGSLGTQRLPRLVGANRALQLISGGDVIGASEAKALGLIDEVSSEDVVAMAVEAIRALSSQPALQRRLSLSSVDPSSYAAAYFNELREKAQRERGRNPALLDAVTAIEAAVNLPFERGEAVEAQAFRLLIGAPQSKAMRHLFFAERAAAKIPDMKIDRSSTQIGRVGILGAGTMGRGIALAFLNADFPVVLVDSSEAALHKAKAYVEEVLSSNVKKGRISAEARALRISLLATSTSDLALGDCDLAIEAIFEDLELKKAVCNRLGEVCKSAAIVATNTSSLNVDVLAGVSGRPDRFIGMHFFSPANLMHLLEVVRGSQTSPQTLQSAIRCGQLIGKIPVVSGVCWGFIGNRMLEPYLRETEFLLLEGATPQQIDNAIERFGFAMGPCRMLDMAGIDVGAKVVIERRKEGKLPPDSVYRVVVQRLDAQGRHGQKVGRGYYNYEGRLALPDPDVEATIRQLASEYAVTLRTDISDKEIVERLLFPLINEGARILEEGISYRPSDIDVVWTKGYGFPEHLGGPMFHADGFGLRGIASGIDYYARKRGNSYGYWSVAPLLRDLAESSGTFSQLSH